MTKVSEEVINNLVAKKIFEDLTSKYCRGLDRIDESLLKGVFWMYSTFNYLFFK